MRITDHQYEVVERLIRYNWPKRVSYHNPVTAVKAYGHGWCVFRLQSGEKTDITEENKGFKDLDWSQITSLVIRYDLDDSSVSGFEFYNSDGQ